MNISRLNFLLLTCSLTTAGIVFTGMANAVQPMSEDDMSNISAEAGSLERLLSVNGSTAAGEDYVATTPDTKDLSSTVSHAKTSSDRLHQDNTKEEGRQTSATQVNPDIDSFNSTIETKTESDMGKAISVVNPKLRMNEASVTANGGLKLENRATIESVYITETRDSHGFDRGNHYFSNINANATTVITGR